jgi:hypothetical protein
MKKIIWVLVIIILGVGVYYGRYFVVDTEVNEAAPEIVNQPQATTFTPKQGIFGEVDRIHKGSGKATLLETNEGKVIRFEDFQVTNGPDLYVWLTKNPNPTTDIESLGEYIDLGRLKGNVGNQNYNVSQNIEGYDTVVVWCKQFSQLFTYANLK